MGVLHRPHQLQPQLPDAARSAGRPHQACQPMQVTPRLARSLFLDRSINLFDLASKLLSETQGKQSPTQELLHLCTIISEQLERPFSLLNHSPRSILHYALNLGNLQASEQPGLDGLITKSVQRVLVFTTETYSKHWSGDFTTES